MDHILLQMSYLAFIKSESYKDLNIVSDLERVTNGLTIEWNLFSHLCFEYFGVPCSNELGTDNGIQINKAACMVWQIRHQLRGQSSTEGHSKLGIKL